LNDFPISSQKSILSPGRHSVDDLEAVTMFSVSEIVDIAIQLERNGERFYRRGIEMVSDDSMRQLLRWLADEEVRHREQFAAMKAGFLRREESRAERVGGSILQSAVSDHAFSLDEVDYSSIVDEAMLVDIAIGFEKDGITFYEIMQGFIDEPETLALIREISDEERKHIELLTERKDVLASRAV